MGGATAIQLEDEFIFIDISHMRNGEKTKCEGSRLKIKGDLRDRGLKKDIDRLS